MNNDLRKKLDFALNLIMSAGEMADRNNQPLEIAYSGGKDSDVILELARMTGTKIRPIYKNTTIDPPGTIKHVIENNVEVMQPKMNFWEIVEKRGMPGRFQRFCCEILKEYKISDYVVVGVRKDESVKRSKRYNEPEQCRIYKNKEKARLYYPLLDWTSKDIEEFSIERGIKFHPLYYDENGNFHAERRLGCIGCPLASQSKRINEFSKHPKLVRLYVKSAQKFLDNHPQSKMFEYLENAEDLFVINLFCKSVLDFRFRFKQKDLFGNTINTTEFLENKFNIKLH